MREPTTDTSINALLARPSEKLSGGEVYKIKKALLGAVATLGEAQLYDDVAAVMKRDPHSAHDMLLRQADENPDADWCFPQIRLQLMLACVEKMKAVEATWEPAGGPLDRAREAAFRKAPWLFLDGAKHSKVELLRPSGFGIVTYEKADWGFTYAAATKGAGDLRGLLLFLQEHPGLEGGIVVGPPCVERELAGMPRNVFFVPIEIETDSPVTGGLPDERDHPHPPHHRHRQADGAHRRWRARVDSRVIAGRFGKRHNDVLRSIKLLIDREPSLALRNFAQGTYTVEETGDHPHPCFLRGSRRLLAPRHGVHGR